MIYNVLKSLKEELDQNMIVPGIVIDDISKADNDTTTISDRIVITLLNIQEEPTLKNSPRYERIQDQDGYIKKNPSAYLNLYVIIAANRNTYENSLVDISKVIEIFQAKKILNYGSGGDEFKFNMQLHPLPFEQLSYAWGLLGGKVMPSVLYKISIIKIQKTLENPNLELITDIDVQSIKINQ